MEIKENIPEYYGLSEAELEISRKSYTPLTIKAKQFFLKEGAVSDKIGFVRSGILRAYFYDNNGNDITTNFFASGSLIVSFDSFNNQVPSRENIIAIEDSELLVITYHRQNELYELIPVWRQICKDVSDKKNQAMLARSVQFQTLSASERYQLFCKENPEIVKKVALRHIASYLGIDIATLSRIRKKK